MKNIQELLIKEMGLKVGDRVKVVYKVPNGHLGWEDTWLKCMDEAIDKTYIIHNIHTKYGVVLREFGGYHFPVQSLMKIPTTTIKLNDQCIAEIDGDVVKVGCQTIPMSKIYEIVEEHKRQIG